MERELRAPRSSDGRASGTVVPPVRIAVQAERDPNYVATPLDAGGTRSGRAMSRPRTRSDEPSERRRDPDLIAPPSDIGGPSRIRAVAAVLLVVCACVGPEDNPTTVRDLRVLGASFTPPELLAPTCDQSAASLAAWASEVTFAALIADPQGQGRPIAYELFACANLSDRRCANADDRVRFAEGETSPGELSLALRPGLAMLPDGKPLLQEVLDQDAYKGLGGLRVPFVLHLKAGDEEIYAQKLMVFDCRFFPEMEANEQPVLPGLLLDGEPWPEDERPVLEGRAEATIEPLDFSEREEAYLVRSFELKRVHLVERWKISWYATLGFVSPGQTGGTDLGGHDSRHRVVWRAPEGAGEQEVTFYAVVRDGRGGEFWLERRALFKP